MLTGFLKFNFNSACLKIAWQCFLKYTVTRFRVNLHVYTINFVTQIGFIDNQCVTVSQHLVKSELSKVQSVFYKAMHSMGFICCQELDYAFS